MDFSRIFQDFSRIFKSFLFFFFSQKSFFFFFIPLGNKVYEGFGTFSGILFNDNFTPNFGTCR